MEEFDLKANWKEQIEKIEKKFDLDVAEKQIFRSFYMKKPGKGNPARNVQTWQ